MKLHLPLDLLVAVISSIRRLTRPLVTASVITTASFSFASDADSVDYSIYSGDIYTYVGNSTRFAYSGITKATLDDRGNIDSYGDIVSSWDTGDTNVKSLFCDSSLSTYNTLRFVAPGSQINDVLTVTQTNMNVFCDFFPVSLGGLIVESGATGYTFRGGASTTGADSTARYIFLGNTNQDTPVQFTINEDFNFGTATSYWATVTQQTNWHIQVAQGKSLNFYVGTLSVANGATSTLSLGGTTADSTNSGTLNLYYKTSATLQTLTFNSGYLRISPISGGYGRLTINTLTENPNGTFIFNLGDNGVSDKIVLTNTYSGSLNLTLVGGSGCTYTLVTGVATDLDTTENNIHIDSTQLKRGLSLGAVSVKNGNLAVELAGQTWTLVWSGDSSQNWSTDTEMTPWRYNSNETYYIDDEDVVFNGEGSPTVTISGIVSPNSITVSGDTSYTLNGGSITGSGRLTMSSTGVLTLSTNLSSWSGTTNLSSGTILLNNNSGLGSGSLLFNGGTLVYGSGITKDIGSLISADGSSDSSIKVNVGNNNVVWSISSSALSNQSLFKSGSGTLTLTIPNTPATYAKDIIVYEGSLICNISSPGTYLGYTNNTRTFSGNITVGSGTSLQIKDARARSYTLLVDTISGIISGSGTFIIGDKYGPTTSFPGGGAYYLSGTNSDFEGNIIFTGTSVTTGSGWNTVKIASGNALGKGTWTLNGKNFYFETAAATVDANVVVTSGTTVNQYSTLSESSTYTYEGSLSGSGTWTYTDNTNNAPITNIFTGNLQGFTGTLQTNSNTATQTWQFGNGATYSPTDGTTNIFGNGSVLGGNTNATEDALAAEYTVNYNNDSLVLNATIAGNSNLTHAGSGILILDKANSYTGTTTIFQGILKLTNDSSVGTGAVTINNSGVLEVANTSTISTATLSNNASLQIDSDASLTATTITGGTLNINGGTLKGTMSGTTISSLTTLNATSTIDTSDGAIEISGIVSATNKNLTVEGENTLTLSGTGNTIGTLTMGEYGGDASNVKISGKSTIGVATVYAGALEVAADSTISSLSLWNNDAQLAITNDATLTTEGFDTSTSLMLGSISFDNGTLKASQTFDVPKQINVYVSKGSSGTIDTSCVAVSLEASVSGKTDDDGNPSTGGTLIKTGIYDLSLKGVTADLQSLAVNSGTVIVSDNEDTTNNIISPTLTTESIVLGKVSEGEDTVATAGTLKVESGEVTTSELIFTTLTEGTNSLVEVAGGTLAVGTVSGTSGSFTLSGGTLTSTATEETGNTPTLAITNTVSLTADKDSAIDTTNANITLSGGLSGTGNLTVYGGNTLTMGRDNSVGNLTLVNNSIIDINGDGIGILNIADITGSGSFKINLGTGNESDKIVATSYSGGTVIINIDVTESGTFTIFSGTGSVSTWSEAFTINANVGRGFTFNKDTDVSITNDNLVIKVNGKGYLDLVWNGNTENTWEASDSPTIWLDSSSNANYFATGDSVTFNDNASNKNVVISGVVNPKSILVDTSSDYSFSDDSSVENSGITGVSTLTKQGSGTLTISNSNSFTGGTEIKEGTISIAKKNSLGSGDITFAGGSLVASDTFEITNKISVDTLAEGTALSVNLSAITDQALTVNLSNSGNSSLSYTYNTSGAVTLVMPTADSTFSGTLTVSTGSTLTLQGHETNDTLEVSSDLAHLAGTLALSNISTLTLTGQSGTFASSLVLNGASLVISGSNTLTLTNSIQNLTELSLTRSANLILNADHTLTNLSIASGSTLNMGANLTTAQLAGEGSLNIGANTLTATADITSDVSLTVASGATIDTGANKVSLSKEISGGISNNGTITKQGSGTLELKGGITSLASVAISAGDLSLNGGSLIATSLTLAANSTAEVDANSTLKIGSTTNNNGTIKVNGGTLASYATTLDLSNHVELASGSVDTTDGDITLTGIVTGTGSVSVTGGKDLILSGTNTSLGTVALTNNSDLKVTKDATINSISSVAGSGIDVANAILTTSGITGTGTISLDGGTLKSGAELSLANTLAFNIGSGKTGTIDTTGGKVTVQGNVSEGSLVKNGNNDLVLNGSNNSFSELTVNEGTVELASDMTIPTITMVNGTSIKLTSGILTTESVTGGTLDLAGGTLQADSSGVTITSATSVTATSTINLSNGNVSLTGTLSGNGALIASGAHTLSIGTSSTLGSLDLTNGTTLTINDSADAVGYSTLTLSDQLTTDTNSAIKIDLGAVGTNDKIIAQNHSGSDKINLILASTNATTEGTYTIFEGSSSLSSDSFNITQRLARGLWIDSNGIKVVDNNLQVTIQGAVNGPLTLTWNCASSNDKWFSDTTSATNWLHNSQTQYFVANDSVTFDNTATNKDVIISGQVTPTAIVVNNSIGNDYTFSADSTVENSKIVDAINKTTLLKQGTGKLTILNSNSFSGGTTIEEGIISIAKNDALGSGAITFAGGSLSASETFELANKIAVYNSEDGETSYTVNISADSNKALTVNLANSGDAALSFNYSTSGNVILAMPGTKSTFSGALTVATGSTLMLQGYETNDTLALSSTLLNIAGTLALTDISALTISGQSETFAGILDLNNATLVISGANLKVTGTIKDLTDLSLTNNSTLILDKATELTNLDIASGSTLTMDANLTTAELAGEGSLDIGANTLTATADITSGVALTVASGAIIDTGTNKVSLSKAISGGASNNGTITKQGSGTLELTGGTSTLASATVSSGDLKLNGASLSTNSLTLATASTAEIDTNSTLKIGSTTTSDGKIKVNGGTLASYAATLNLSNHVELESGSVDTTDGDVTLTGIVTGTGSVSVTGGKDLILSGTNTSLGTVALTNNSDLKVTKDATINSISSVVGSEIDVTNAILTTSGITGTGTISLDGGTLKSGAELSLANTLSFNIGSGKTGTIDTTGGKVTVQGNVSEGSLVKKGNNDLVLFGNNRLYELAVNEGSVDLASDMTIPTITMVNGTSTKLTSGILTTESVTGGTLDLAGGTLQADSSGVTITSATSVTATSTINLSNGNVSLTGTLSGNGTLIASGAHTLSIGTSSTLGSLALTNGVTLTINDSANAVGYSTLTLSGQLTTDTNSAIKIDLGTIGTNDKIIAQNYSSPDTVNLILASTNATTEGTYTIFEGSASLSSDSFNITQQLARGLWIDSDGIKVVDNNLQVTIQGAVNGPLALTWNGASSNDKWFSDTTATTDWLHNSQSQYFVANDSVTFDNTAINKDVVISGPVSPKSILIDSSSNYSFSSDSLVENSGISGSATLTKQGSGTLNINNANYYEGDTTIKEGTISIDNANALGTSTIIFAGGSLSSTKALELNNKIAVNTPENGSTSTVNLLATSGALTVNLTNSGDAPLSFNYNTSGAVTLVMPTANSTFSGALTVAKDSTLTLQGNTSNDTLNVSSDLTDIAGTLAFNGISTLTLTSQAGAFSGTLDLNGASLVVSSANALDVTGTIEGFTDLSLINGSTLALNKSTTLTKLNLDSGTTLSMNADLTTAELGGSGSLDIGTHTLALTNTTTLTSSVALSVGSGAVIDTGIHDIKLSSAITGNASFSKQGSGVLVLTNTNTDTGVLTVTAGSVQFGDGGNNDAVWAGTIAGSGNVAVNTTGSLVLTGDNSNTGTLSIKGNVQLGNDTTTAKWSGTSLDGSGTLTLVNGSLTSAITRTKGSVATIVVNSVSNSVIDLANTSGSLISSITLASGSSLCNVNGDITIDQSATKALNITLSSNNLGEGKAANAAISQSSGSKMIINAPTTVSLNTDALVDTLIAHKNANTESYLTLTTGIIECSDLSSISFSQSLSDYGLRLTKTDGGSLVLSGEAMGIYTVDSDGKYSDPDTVTNYATLGMYTAVVIDSNDTLTLSLNGGPTANSADGDGAVINNILGNTESILALTNASQSTEDNDAVVIIKAGETSGAITAGNDVTVQKQGSDSLTIDETGTLTVNDTLELQEGSLVLGSTGNSIGSLVLGDEDNKGKVVVTVNGDLKTALSEATDANDNVVSSGATVTVVKDASLEIAGDSTLTNTTISGNGYVVVDSCKTLSISNDASLAVSSAEVNGTLVLDGQTTSLATLSGTGNVTITDGSLELSDTSSVGKITLKATEASNTTTLTVDQSLVTTLKEADGSGATSVSVFEKASLEIAGDSTLTKTVISGNGGVVVDSGKTLSISNDASMDVSSAEVNGTLVLDGQTTSLATLSGIGDIAVTDGSLELTDKGAVGSITLNSTKDTSTTSLSIDKSLATTLKEATNTKATAISVSKDGTLEISGDTSLTKTDISGDGGITVDADKTLSISNEASLGVSSAEVNGTLVLDGQTTSLATLSGIGDITVTDSSLDLTGKSSVGSITLNSTKDASTTSLTIDNSLDTTLKEATNTKASSVSVSKDATLKIAGNTSLTKTDISGEGNVTVDSGKTLAIKNDASLDVSSVTVNGSLDLDGQTSSIATLSGSGDVTVTDSSLRLTDASSVGSITLGSTADTTMTSLTVGSSLSTTLKETTNSKSTSVTVSKGASLEIVGDTSLTKTSVSGDGGIVVDSGKTLDISDEASLDVTSARIDGTLNLNGQANTISTLSGSGDVTVKNGSLVLTNASSVGSITLKSTDTDQATALTVDKSLATRLKEVVESGTTSVSVSKDASLEISDDTVLTNTSVSGEGGVIVDSGKTLSIRNDASLDVSSVTINGSLNLDSQSTSLARLSGTGDVTVTDGSLVLTDVSSIGSITLKSTNVALATELTVDKSLATNLKEAEGTNTVSVNVEDGANLSLKGDTTLTTTTISGKQNGTSTVKVDDGQTLAVSDNATLSNIGIELGEVSTLALSNDNVLTFLTGHGALELDNASLELQATDNTATTLFGSGTLKMNNGTLALTGTDSSEFSGALDGAGTLSVENGALTLNSDGNDDFLLVVKKNAELTLNASDSSANNSSQSLKTRALRVVADANSDSGIPSYKGAVVESNGILYLGKANSSSTGSALRADSTSSATLLKLGDEGLNVNSGGTISLTMNVNSVQELVDQGALVESSGTIVLANDSTVELNNEGAIGSADQKTFKAILMTSQTSASVGDVNLDDKVFNSIYKTSLLQDGNDVVLVGEQIEDNVFIPSNTDTSTPNSTPTASTQPVNAKAGANLLWNARFNLTEGSLLRDVYSSILDLSGDATNKALAAVAGSTINATGTAQRDALRDQMSAVRNRASQLDTNGSELGHHFWIEGTGSYSNLHTQGDKGGYKLITWGGSVGADTAVDSNLSIGAALTANYGDLRAHAAEDASGDLDSIYVNLFGRYRSNAWGHTLVLTGTNTEAKLDRTVNYGSRYYHTSGKTHGYGLGATYELTYDITLNDNGTSLIQPLFDATIVSTKLQGYKETGADNAGLDVDAQEWTTASLALGVHWSGSFGAQTLGQAIFGDLRTTISQDFGDKQGKTAVALQGIPGYSQNVYGAKVGATAVQISGGLSTNLTPNSTIYANVTADFRNNENAVSGTIGYRYSF